MTVHGQRPHDGHDEPRYAIQIAARLVGVAPRTLRRYEQLGLLDPAPTPRPRGPRYTDADLEQLRLIGRLIDDLGVNLAGAAVILHMRGRLLELRRELDGLRRELDRRAE